MTGATSKGLRSTGITYRFIFMGSVLLMKLLPGRGKNMSNSKSSEYQDQLREIINFGDPFVIDYPIKLITLDGLVFGVKLSRVSVRGLYHVRLIYLPTRFCISSTRTTIVGLVDWMDWTFVRTTISIALHGRVKRI